MAILLYSGARDKSTVYSIHPCYNFVVTVSWYTMPFHVTLYDLDLREEVSCAQLLRYFEEAAMLASTHLGFDINWYRARGQFWVIRLMRMERSCPARFQDELELRTWVSSMTRVRADRNYLVRRKRDGCVLARGTANWVYLDAKTLFPARIAPEIVSMFQDRGPPALPRDGRLSRWLVPVRDWDYSSRRRGQYYEADSARHTNNAVYVDWLEEAIREALLSNNYTLPLEGGTSLWFYRHALEYLNSAIPGDEIEITTRLVGKGHSTGKWEQEIQRVKTREPLVRSESITIWRSKDNRIVPWPIPDSRER